MFIPERWAEAFINTAGSFSGAAAAAESAEEGLAVLRAVLPLVRGIPGEVSGRTAALRLERMLRAAAAVTGESTTPPQADGVCCSCKVFDSGSKPLVPPQGAGVWTLRNESPGVETAIRFLVLLVKKGGLRFSGSLIGAIEKIIDRQRGVLECVLESADPPDEDVQEDLKQALMKKTGAKDIRFLSQIRPELLGGFRLRLGDEILDASLRGQLGQMAADLESGPVNLGGGAGGM
ncbi:MAG: F0F1 ATP synthase subunit delta [Treponema sp.]|jgi:F-type H+-transporting ATPase subunit delta|nr:F0F1 ATP synthase subunit delta [Treponema sp.]